MNQARQGWVDRQKGLFGLPTPSCLPRLACSPKCTAHSGDRQASQRCLTAQASGAGRKAGRLHALVRPHSGVECAPWRAE